MRNKFINLLLQELSLDLKICTVFLFIILSVFFLKNMRLKTKEVAKLHQDKITVQNLEKQIPGLGDKLKDLQARGKMAGSLSLRPKANFVLKGIVTKEGESVALIGDDICKKNDTISGFIVTSITPNTVTLADPVTGEQNTIQLSE